MENNSNANNNTGGLGSKDNAISKKSQDEIKKGIEYMLKQVEKSKPLTEKQKKELIEYAKEALAFDEVIENIDISGENFKVIFTDGEEQLIYDNGEFFIVSSIDSKKVKAKKKRNEARNIYIEYFIKYQLNPIIEQKNKNGNIKIISGNGLLREDKDIKKLNKKDEKLKEEKLNEKEQKKEEQKGKEIQEKIIINSTDSKDKDIIKRNNRIRNDDDHIR